MLYNIICFWEKQSSLLFNNFYCLFLFINKTSPLINLKTSTAMNAKISVFVICVEAIMNLLLYNFHDWTFNSSFWLSYLTFCIWLSMELQTFDKTVSPVTASYKMAFVSKCTIQNRRFSLTVVSTPSLSFIETRGLSPN